MLTGRQGTESEILSGIFYEKMAAGHWNQSHFFFLKASMNDVLKTSLQKFRFVF